MARENPTAVLANGPDAAASSSSPAAYSPDMGLALYIDCVVGIPTNVAEVWVHTY